MRRVVLFLALLVVGALILWLVDVYGPQRPAPAPVDGESDAPLIPAPEQQGELTEIETDKSKSGQFAHSGPFEVFVKDLELPGQPLELHAKSQDSRTLADGAIDLMELELERFDTDSGALELELRAGRARAKLSRLGQIDSSTPVAVRDALVTYHTASRFAPLRFETPQLEIDLEAQRATSDELVSVFGVGMFASGRGLDFDGVGEVLTLRSEPNARFEVGSSRQARLEGRGPLVARSRPDLVPTLGEGAASIELVGGGRLVLDGAPPLEVTAESIELLGRVERAASNFVPMVAQASGGVRVEAQVGGVFESERLTLDFDSLGKPLRAAFDGSPRFELALRERALENVPAALLVEGEQLTVRGDGAGPLEVFFESPERLRFNAPARVFLPALGSELTCQESIEASLSPRNEIESLELVGDVRAEHEGWTLRSERVTASALRGGLEERWIRIESPGPVSLQGATARGFETTLRSRERLIADFGRSASIVRSASGVDFEVREDGELAYAARADELRELDPEQLSFVAEGAVEFQSREARGAGERLEAWAMDRAELSGSPEIPARLEARNASGAWSSFRAQFIDVQSDYVHARGDVSGRVALEGLEYALEAPWVVAALQSPRAGGEPELELRAGGGVTAQVLRGEERIDLAGKTFQASARKSPGGDEFEPTLSSLSGDVSFSYDGELRLAGDGEVLELRADRTGRLQRGDARRARLKGRLPSNDAEFEMFANQVEFSAERITALDTETFVDGVTLAFGGRNAPAEARKLRMIAGGIDCDARSIVLSDGVTLEGKTADLEDWDLDCNSAVVRLDTREGVDLDPLQRVRELLAWGAVRLNMGAMGVARCAAIELSSDPRTLVMRGDDGVDETREATLERGQFQWQAPRIELALDTGYLRSDGAVVRPLAQDRRDSWTLSYEALEPLPAGDETIQVFRAPVWRSGDVEVRAAWALAWVDAAKWRALGVSDSRRVADPDAGDSAAAPRFFGRVDLELAQEWLHELYLDGEVEYRVNGENQIRAEGVYMDLIDGHGWIVDALLDFELPIGSRRYKLKLQADWLRHSLDGSMETSNAVATTCTHASPHYVIKIGTFARRPRYATETRIHPQTRERETRTRFDGYEVSLDDNAIDFLGPYFKLPLPRIAGRQDENSRFDRDSVSVGSLALPSFGQDSKLGTFISANFTTDIGPVVRGFHWLVDRLFSGRVKLPAPEGDTRIHADLNSRGLVVGTDTRFVAKDRYRWRVIFDAIYDTDDDRGLVRVDRDDRSDGRAWLRARGRHLLGPDEWIDLVITRQSDPGVQSEFFERDFLRFEERETLVHWRRADRSRYTSVTAETRLEDFRSEVVEQPTFHSFNGRADIGDLGPFALVHSSLFSVQNLARFEGDDRYRELPFADGLGDRDVLRFDGATRIESPIDTHVAGLRVTPFVEGRLTGWSENAAQTDQAGRVGLIAGVQASTTFWKVSRTGNRHVWTPSIAYRGDLAYADDGGPVARFDVVDDSIEGRFVDFAVRSRWEHRELASDLDVEFVQTHAASAGPVGDAWLPLVARTTWLSRVLGIPFGGSHDARYDLEGGETLYSRTLLGFEPISGLDLEIGHHRGRDVNRAELYDAATVGARYAFSRKWEIEGRQTFSARDSGDSLAYSFVIRRIGHDFVFELENSVVAGEGRPSLRFKFTPLFAWRNANPSMLDRWRASRQ